MALERPTILQTSEILKDQKRIQNKVFVAFIVSMTLNVLLTISIVILMPLKEKAPYLMFFSNADKNFVKVLPIGEEVRGETALMKSIVASYVSKRETINRIDDENRYLDIRMQSATEVFNTFVNLIKQDKGFYKNASITREIKIKNVSLITKEIAQVDFVAKLSQNKTLKEVKAFRATIRFVFDTQVIPENDIEKNPMGFAVTAYAISEINDVADKDQK